MQQSNGCCFSEPSRAEPSRLLLLLLQFGASEKHLCRQKKLPRRVRRPQDASRAPARRAGVAAPLRRDYSLLPDLPSDHGRCHSPRRRQGSVLSWTPHSGPRGSKTGFFARWERREEGVESQPPTRERRWGGEVFGRGSWGARVIFFIAGRKVVAQKENKLAWRCVNCTSGLCVSRGCWVRWQRVALGAEGAGHAARTGPFALHPRGTVRYRDLERDACAGAEQGLFLYGFN